MEIYLFILVMEYRGRWSSCKRDWLVTSFKMKTHFENHWWILLALPCIKGIFLAPPSLRVTGHKDGEMFILIGAASLPENSTAKKGGMVERTHEFLFFFKCCHSR